MGTEKKSIRLLSAPVAVAVDAAPYTARRSPASHLDINVETLDVHLEDLADLRSNKCTGRH